jgi:hypothetical protein
MRQRLFQLLLNILCLFFANVSIAQKAMPVVSGKILNENDQPFSGVTVQVLNSTQHTITNNDGFFSITLPANKPVALVFSFTGYITAQRNFNLNHNEKENISIKLAIAENILQNVTVKDNSERTQAGLVNIDASKSLLNPSPVNGVEGLIKTIVGSNNELTSQYNVHGGNYDENLVYINGFEVYRPYLVTNAQQEGLSLINPALTSGTQFFEGGYQAKYGDKMSSVLDVAYHQPSHNAGSAYISLLEQGLHLEGSAKNNKVTYLFGARNKSNQSLLSSQETTGNYIPSSSDIQALVGWQVNNKLRLEAFGILSQTTFTFYPQQSEQTAAVFSPLYASAIGLNTSFEGQEKDRYATSLIGLTAIHQLNKKLQLKWMLHYFGDKEHQNTNIISNYIFGERDIDNGGIPNPLGAGTNQKYTGDSLHLQIWNASHTGWYNAGNHYLQWGNAIEIQTTNNHLHDWLYQDSAGYSYPANTSPYYVYTSRYNDTAFNLVRLQGFVQDNMRFGKTSSFTMQAGLRYNYNTLNKEFLLSPRVGFSYQPKKWRKDFIFRAAAGRYVQPPFYREMIRPDATINTQLKAQKSWQFSGGFDYSFKMLQRPARLTTEAYYKNMTDVDAYNIINTGIQYDGENNAKAYAFGIETRLHGELVKDAESWISIGFMKTEENLNNDYYTQYKNAEGQVIDATTPDKTPVDSSQVAVGWVRRPTDRRITFGMFFQDYLSTNKNFKVYLNTIYGSNMPYNIPGNPKYRNALEIEPYIRADIGFSALLLDASKPQRNHSPFRSFKSIWASIEVFNVIDRANTISYTLIKDVANNTYAIPNRLTPRLLNFKIAASW